MTTGNSEIRINIRRNLFANLNLKNFSNPLDLERIQLVLKDEKPLAVELVEEELIWKSKALDACITKRFPEPLHSEGDFRILEDERSDLPNQPFYTHNEPSSMQELMNIEDDADTSMQPININDPTRAFNEETEKSGNMH